MKCPFCHSVLKTRVIATQRDAQGNVRRRRECQNCAERFNTLERSSAPQPLKSPKPGNGAWNNYLKLCGNKQEEQ